MPGLWYFKNVETQNTDNYVNPLDMDVWSLDLNDRKGMIREKANLCPDCVNSVWGKALIQGRSPSLTAVCASSTLRLLQNYTATTMLANSEFVALLKQANTDSSRMAELIGVSEAQLRFVTNTSSGMGLMKCENVVIPFDNTIEKGTDLYNLYNTNIHEKIQMQKMAEKSRNAVDNASGA